MGGGVALGWRSPRLSGDMLRLHATKPEEGRWPSLNKERRKRRIMLGSVRPARRAHDKDGSVRPARRAHKDGSVRPARRAQIEGPRGPREERKSRGHRGPREERNAMGPRGPREERIKHEKLN